MAADGGKPLPDDTFCRDTFPAFACNEHFPIAGCRTYAGYYSEALAFKGKCGRKYAQRSCDRARDNSRNSFRHRKGRKRSDELSSVLCDGRRNNACGTCDIYIYS